MKSLLLLSFIGIFIVFSSCENPNSVVEEQSIEILKESTYSINTNNTEYVEIVENNESVVKVVRDSTKSNPQRNIFNGILKRMNLDSNQMRVANELLIKHHICVQSCLTIVKLEEKRILDSAKTIREEIKIQVDSNQISKLEARIKIRELNESIKRQLKTLNEKYKVKECMDNCDREFIRSLFPILNPTQLEMFNKWIHQNRIGYEKRKEKDSVDRRRDSTKGRG